MKRPKYTKEFWSWLNHADWPEGLYNDRWTDKTVVHFLWRAWKSGREKLRLKQKAKGYK